MRSSHFWLILGLPWFLLRLFLAIFPSLVVLSLEQIPAFKLAIGTTLVLLSQLVFMATHILYPPRVYKPASFSPDISLVVSNPLYPSPLPTSLMQHLSDSSTELVSVELSGILINHYSALLRRQPTHRDVLLNLALLHSWNNQGDKAQVYWERAQELDPNSPLLRE